MPIDPLTAGLMGGSMVADIFGGISQGKKQDKLFKEFKRSVARREREQVDLERIARGEIQTSLTESKHLFGNVMQAISASNSVESRRFFEDLARREAVADIRGRQRGLMGSTATAAESLARERETFRGALDAEARRSAQMGQVYQQQIGVTAGLRGDLANSYRQEGAIREQAGQKMQRALEQTSVNYSPVTKGVSSLLAQMGLLNQGGNAAGGEMTYREGVGMRAAIKANPFIGADL